MNKRYIALTLVLCLSTWSGINIALGDDPTPVTKYNNTIESGPTIFQVGKAGTIINVRTPPSPRGSLLLHNAEPTPFPRPRLIGFSPLIAIAASNEGLPVDILSGEHKLENTYIGAPLNGPANQNFVVGILDSGAEVSLVAGASSSVIGLDQVIRGETFPIGGVGDAVIFANMTEPIGLFAAGLSAVSPAGILDLTKMVGQSNASILSSPSIACANGESVTAVVGLPILSFFNSIIRMDSPRTVNISGKTFVSPDVTIQDEFQSLPTFAHQIQMLRDTPATTASYFAFLDPFDLSSELISPTALALFPGSIPTGGLFFAEVELSEFDEFGANTDTALMLVDTGAQGSVISFGVAASLSLPFAPDFTVDVCGVGGLVTDIEGFYIDNVKMDARGGALRFSQAPVIVLDLTLGDGTTLDGILGMNFFWNRNVIFEPNLGGSGFFHVSAPIPFAYADFDLDFDVDGSDVGTFVACMTDSGIQKASPECMHVDADGDEDVDLADFSHLITCYSGVGVSAIPNCGR